jgi:hypothetical protein
MKALALIALLAGLAHADGTPIFSVRAVRRDRVRLGLHADVGRGASGPATYLSGGGLGLELEDGAIDLGLAYRDLRVHGGRADWAIALRAGLNGFLDPRYRLGLTIHGEVGAGDTGSLLRAEAGFLVTLGDAAAVTLSGGVAKINQRDAAFPLVTLALTVHP